MTTKNRKPGIGDEAVERATGRNWDAWFRILDDAGARKLDHKGIVAILSASLDVGPWWRQMVAVGYEQAHGLRKKHETRGTFEISGSKTVGVPLADLFRAWSDRKLRRLWLDDPDFTVRKATPSRSLRITWVDGVTNVDVNFMAKGDRKSQVALGHGKLPSAREGERMKRYWAAALDRMKACVEDRGARPPAHGARGTRRR